MGKLKCLILYGKNKSCILFKYFIDELQLHGIYGNKCRNIVFFCERSMKEYRKIFKNIKKLGNSLFTMAVIVVESYEVREFNSSGRQSSEHRSDF